MNLPTIADLAKDLASGVTTAERLARAALGRAEDPAGEGSRVFIRVDAAGALAAARASDSRLRTGRARSPLEGVPISVKDLFDVAGEVTTAGSIVLRDGPLAAGPAREDAPVVARLRAAGAVIVGRTNMTEFAYSGLGLNPHYGTPRNAWDRACDGGAGRIPGGSSSGAAVGVTDGMAVMALGTDTGGSVRLPAALNGIAGFKPTAARIPTAGAYPLSPTMDSIGPLAPSVACCALVDAVLAGERPSVPDAMPLAQARLAVPQTLVLDALDPEVGDAFGRALSAIRAAGATVTEVALPEFGEIQRAIANGTFTAREGWAWHKGMIARDGRRYDPRVLARLERGEQMTEAAYRQLFEVRADVQRRMAEALSGYTAMLLPTVPVVPPRIAPLLADDRAYVETNLRVLRNTTLINFVDGCGLSIPIHAAGAAPVGLMVAQLGGHDRAILAVGRAIEQAVARLRARG